MKISSEAGAGEIDPLTYMMPPRIELLLSGGLPQGIIADCPDGKLTQLQLPGWTNLAVSFLVILMHFHPQKG